jgi:15-cis-phytoene synthase
MTSVAESYRVCAQLAHHAASNFYYTFYLLPRPQRMAMCAVYAYLRELDDLADAPISATQNNSLEPATDSGRLSFDKALFEIQIENLSTDQRIRLNRLNEVHDRFQKALNGEMIGPVLPALADTIRKFSIPPEYFVEVMRGMAMDIQGREYVTWSDLEKYCFRVASVVGLICLHIWGVTDPAADEPAIACGYAFQMTNILRDMGADAAVGRIYLPEEDLQKAGYTRDELYNKKVNDQFQSLITIEWIRTNQFFMKAATLPRFLPRSARKMYAAMLGTYAELIYNVIKDADQLFSQRIRVSRWRKLCIIVRSFLFN